MIYNRLLVLGVLLVTASCGPKELSFDESTEDVKIDDFHLAMTTSLDSADVFEFRGSADFDQDGSSVSFGYTIRMKRDSVIWMDITDPYVGLKVARALIMPDSAVMYNRFESNWMAGGTSVIQRAFQVNMEFKHLQAVLLGEPIYIPESVDDLSITRLIGVVDAMVKGLPNDPLFTYAEPAYLYSYGYVDGLPLTRMSFSDSLSSASISYIYPDNETGLPSDIDMTIQRDGVIHIKFDHSDVQRNVDLHIPFSIPSGYERIQ